MKKKKQLVKHYNNVIVAVVIFLLFPSTFFGIIKHSCICWESPANGDGSFSYCVCFAVITVNNSEITVLFSCYFWLIFLYK